MSLKSFLPKSKQVATTPTPPGASAAKAAVPNDVAIDLKASGLPTSFGKAPSSNAPHKHVPKQNKREREEEEEEDQEKEAKVMEQEVVRRPNHNVYAIRDCEDEPHQKLPVSHQIELKSHTKNICSLDVETKGARVVTVSSDYSMKLWDFTGMDGSFQPFRTIEPREGHNILWTRFSPKGGMIAVAPGNNQAKLYDRDGDELLEYVKGDPYLMQMRATKGHCAMVTCCEWHPINKECLLTCAMDCTIRLWSTEDKSKHQQIIVGSKNAGKKMGFSVASFSPDASMIVGAMTDGTLSLWDAKGSLARPQFTVPLSKDYDCGALSFDSASNLLVCRAGPDMWLWDSRFLRDPVHIWTGLCSRELLLSAASGITCEFSPDNSMIVTPLGASSLGFFSRTTFAPVNKVELGSSALQICWNAYLNQIICGQSDGVVKVLYDPELSQRGALVCAERPVKRKEQEQDWAPGMGTIFNPDVEDEEKRRQRKKDKEAGKKRAKDIMRPDLPVQGPGVGGQTGATQQHMLLKKILNLYVTNFFPLLFVLTDFFFKKGPSCSRRSS